ncbi:hypothetical protein ABIB68_006669 [Bradyrhizobium sp. F1.2.2]
MSIRAAHEFCRALEIRIVTDLKFGSRSGRPTLMQRHIE